MQCSVNSNKHNSLCRIIDAWQPTELWQLVGRQCHSKAKAQDHSPPQEMMSPPPVKRTKSSTVTPNTMLNIPTPLPQHRSNATPPAFHKVDDEKYPLLAKLQSVLGSEWDDKRMCDELFIELTRMLGYGSFIVNAKGKRHSYSWVNCCNGLPCV